MMKTFGLKPVALLYVSVGIVILIIISFIYLFGDIPYISREAITENAAVQGHITTISPEVSGKISEVYVSDFATVKKGQLLFKINDDKYRIAHALALSEYDRVASELKTTDYNIETAKQDIDQAILTKRKDELDYQNKKSDFERYASLVNKGGVSRSNYDNVNHSYKVSRVESENADLTIERAKNSLALALESRKTMQASLDTAAHTIDQTELDLEHTRITAFQDGQLGQLYISPGDTVESGSALTVISTANPWIVANFKENQLRFLKTGRRVSYQVDALPGKTYSGTISRLSPVSLGETSSINASNAAGNFIKIPQKFAVIIIPDSGSLKFLKPGMSVVVIVPGRD